MPNRRIPAEAAGAEKLLAGDPNIQINPSIPVPLTITVERDPNSNAVKALTTQPVISPAQRTSLSNEIASIQAEGGYLQLPPNYSITVNLSDVALKQVSKNVELEWEPKFARLLVWRDSY
jgi:hypothetical protein